VGAVRLDPGTELQDLGLVHGEQFVHHIDDVDLVLSHQEIDFLEDLVQASLAVLFSEWMVAEGAGVRTRS
jgi:hypothetical protein